MTWNSRDSARAGLRIALPSCLFALVACAAAPATDAPAPALVKMPKTVTAPKEDPYHGRRPTIREVQARNVSKDDPWVKRIVHPDDIGKLRAPVLISVKVDRPFSDLARTASPVIVLDGTPLSNSIVVREETDRVHAVADGAQLGAALNVQVGWLGALPETLSSAVEAKVVTGK